MGETDDIGRSFLQMVGAWREVGVNALESSGLFRRGGMAVPAWWREAEHNSRK